MEKHISIKPGLRKGRVRPPVSKSHLHRLLVADFLAGDFSRLCSDESDSEDIKATKRCLSALGAARRGGEALLDCGESGSTMRFLAPVAAALGVKAVFKKAGRLAERPSKYYGSLESGLFRLEGNVSSQFATGLLFALPLLEGDSRIEFSSPLESRGYVDMTLDVLRGAGIRIDETPSGAFEVPGSQKYVSQKSVAPETDWSGAAFWVAANAMGNRIEIDALPEKSLQPDAAVRRAVRGFGGEIDMSGFPDSFPALAVAAARVPAVTRFVKTRRLRIKESDRVAAIADLLGRFGVKTEAGDDFFEVRGTDRPFAAAAVSSFGDHRIAMAAAVGATCADGAVEIDDAACAAKSYPAFFDQFSRLEIFTQALPGLAAVGSDGRTQRRNAAGVLRRQD